MFRHTILLALTFAFAAPSAFAAADAKAPPKLTAEAVEKVWTNLGRHDDEGCFQALADMERLVQAPDLAVPFLRDHLKPVPAVDMSGVAKLVADLDSNDFATRDKAFKALATFGSKARPILERKLEEKELSLELQNSLKRLVQDSNNAEGRGLSASDLRALRGIEVLGQIGSPAAREILEKLAKGDDASALTVTAQRALKMLDERAKK